MSININDEWSMHRHVCGHSFNHLFILLLHFLFMHFRAKDSCPPARSQTCLWTPEPLVDIADGLWCPENAQPCVLNEQPWPQCFLGREEQKGLELQQLPIFSPSTSPTRSMIRKLWFEAHGPHLTLLGPEQLSPNWLQQQCLMRATECNFQFSSSRVKRVKRREEFFNDKFYLTQYIKKISFQHVIDKKYGDILYPFSSRYEAFEIWGLFYTDGTSQFGNWIFRRKTWSVFRFHKNLESKKSIRQLNMFQTDFDAFNNWIKYQFLNLNELKLNVWFLSRTGHVSDAQQPLGLVLP